MKLGGWVLLAVTLLLVVGIAALSYRSAVDVRAAADGVAAEQRILQQAARVLALATDAETGQRGYLLTGDPGYLAPYRRALTALPEGVQRLRDVTAGSADQQQRVDELRAAIDRKLAELRATIEAQRARGSSAALDIVRTGEGQAQMDRIRALLGDIVERESQRLGERQVLITRTTRDATSLTIAALVLAVVTTTLAAALIVGAVRGRERQRAALAQQEIRERVTQRLAAIVENSDDAIIGKDLAGVITSWNAAAERMFGYSAAEAIGRPIMIIVPPDRVAEEEEVIRRLGRGGRTDHFDTVRWTQDGRLVDISLTVSPIRDSGAAIVGASTIARDITERKRVEDDLKRLNETLEDRVAERTRQLAEINAELDAFGYTVSHDLRAPLRAMNGFAKALLTAYGDKLDARGHDFARRVVAAAEQMDQLIQDLLTYSRLSREELRARPQDLADVVGEVLATLQADIRQRAASIAVADTLGQVMANRPTLTQVVTNLISNAIKFVAAGVTPRVRIWSEPRDGSERLWVHDNGIGIDPAHHARIFHVFERLHGHEAYPGTGIGLAIVRRATERMGGRVGVDSRAGAGAAFWIELPRATSADGS